ncbi:MAG: hypothetical protein ACYC09_14790 [Bacteroidota bacterium]
MPAAPNKAHIIFDEDLTEYLQEFTNRSGFPSVTFSAHFLLRMIRSGEVTAGIDLKDNIPMPLPQPGKQPIIFRKKIRMRMKI